MPRLLTLIVIALVLSVSGGIGLATSGGTARGPAAVPVPVAPVPGQDLTSTIQALQDTLRRLPEDHTAWAGLAFAYVEQGRLTGVPSYYEKASEAADRSLDLEPDDNFSGLAASAAIASARHDFDAALDLADQSLAINPRGLSALAVRVDALTELGRYDEQLAALRIADRLQPSTAVAARYAYAFELRGEQSRAASVLESAADTSVRSDRSYLMTLFADIQRRLGRLPQAAEALRNAREATPGYLPAQVSLARLHIARGEPDRALTIWQKVVAQQPLPEYLTELGELYLHLGREVEAREQFAVVDATVTLLEAGGVNADLETALHEADHGSARRALRLAAAEWERRHSIHVADAYGWALHQVGRDARALELARRATALGTPDPRFWIHRGSIEAALGMERAASIHLRRGLAGDPGLSPWQRAQARAVLQQVEGSR